MSDGLRLTPQGMRAYLHYDAKANGRDCPLPDRMPDGSPCCEACCDEQMEQASK